jgi:hypothetical protein
MKTARVAPARTVRSAPNDIAFSFRGGGHFCNDGRRRLILQSPGPALPRLPGLALRKFPSLRGLS